MFVVQGHELWIEYPGKVPSGADVESLLKYGHRLDPDGLADISRVRIKVYDPRRSVQRLTPYVDPNRTTRALIASFTPEVKGPYNLLAEYEAGVWNRTKDGKHYRGPKASFEGTVYSAYYYGYSRALIPVGETPVEFSPELLNYELEIIPTLFRRFRVGEELVLHVLYEGKPLGGATMKVIATGMEDLFETEVDRDGLAQVSLDRPGIWKLLVRHADKSKGVEGEYDERVVTSVFTVNCFP